MFNSRYKTYMINYSVGGALYVSNHPFSIEFYQAIICYIRKKSFSVMLLIIFTINDQKIKRMMAGTIVINAEYNP